MQIALGIGTMLLGGWVLTSPADNPQSDTIVTPLPEQSETYIPPPDSTKEIKEKNAERARSLKHNSFRRESDLDQGGSVEERIKARSSAQQQGSNAYKPMAPTDSSGGGQQGLPLPPTQASEDGSQYGEQSNGGPSYPVAPTYRPSSYRSSSSLLSSSRSVLDQRLGTDMSMNPSYSAQTAEKAFANQRVFTSGVSPYMGLFRNDTAGGTIDNYSTFVRPALDQQKMNQQFGMDIYGLERNARIQNANLQRMDRRNRAPQNVATPQFIMQGGAGIDYGNGYGNGYGAGQ